LPFRIGAPFGSVFAGISKLIRPFGGLGERDMGVHIIFGEGFLGAPPKGVYFSPGIEV